VSRSAYYRRQAEALRKLASATSDEDEALALRLRAIEYDYLAEQAEGGQVEQHGTDLPPPTPASPQGQPAQQQQQEQPKDED
jgi:hypothetical protein